VLLLAPALSLFPPTAGAQDLQIVVNGLHEGDFVRVVSLSREEPVIGRFVRAGAESAWVKPASSKVDGIPFTEVDQLDTSEEQHRSTLAGLALGALVSGAIGYAILKANENSGETTGMTAFIIFPFGPAIGALVGSGIVRYDWRTQWQRP
jgi:hypothetical protein